jgi:hypothetical protein
MSISITESILSSNKFYTDKYIKDTINLVKSITVLSTKEASLYNEHISVKYPQHQIDLSNKSTWRYYKHVTSQYHALDLPITLTSIDNGETITLNPTTLKLHRITHKELLKFDLLYKELVDKYPEQELLIKSLIATSPKYTIQEILSKEEFTILHYNANLVEENEQDLIHELQYRIDHYKNTKLIPYYSLSDSLFVTSQYHVFYTYLFTTLIALRLSNAKTTRAHSYHILNYLSSHHYLDIHYDYLTKKQSLYLYRNLLYLNNHAGREHVFHKLIERLFTERNISVVNYTYAQTNTLRPDNHMDYTFKQKLLNNTNLVYSYKEYELQDILNKERSMALSNPKEIQYNYTSIDDNFKNQLYSLLLTKDIETIVIDNTDTVRYKLLPMIVDYWAYLLKTNQMRYLVTVTDPVSNKELRLSTEDLFKLYTLTLYKRNNETLTYFPDYTIKRVFKPSIPTTNTLLKYFYRKHYYHAPIIDTIRAAIPPYTTTVTSHQFEQQVSSIYKLNIGLWLFLTNNSDKDDEGQFSNLIANLHTTDTYTFNNETPSAFLNRIGMEHLNTYTPEALDTILYMILNNLYDNKLDFLNKYKYIQKSLIEIFRKFNSYTVQVIDNYSLTSPILAGHKDTRTTIDQDKTHLYYFTTLPLLNIEMYYRTKSRRRVTTNFTLNSTTQYNDKIQMEVSPNLTIGLQSKANTAVYFSNQILNGLDNTDWLATQSSDEHLLFLALNV